jgi:positive regulator of sigma E activity
MDHPEGTVVSITASDVGREAIVEVDAAAVCARCAAGKGCGALAFAGRAGKRRVTVTIPPGVDLGVGDSVNVTLEPRNVLLAAAIVYGWPLTGAALGAGIAIAASYGDAAAAASALTGLAAGAVLARQRLLKAGCQRRFMPRIVV